MGDANALISSTLRRNASLGANQIRNKAT